MKSAINFYYNLYPDEVFSQDNFYYFFIDEDKYYFVPFNNDEKVVDLIYNQLNNLKIKTNLIIYNKENKIGTLYKEKLYAMLKVNCIENEVVNLDEFLNIPIDVEVSDWGKVWGEKLDYYAYQVSQRGLKKEGILNSFSYYAGMGENAIEYYNLINNKPNRGFIKHRRVYDINYEINYFNPLNLVIDYSVRDIAEYIKSAFFKDNLNIDKVINYINKNFNSEDSINLIFSRLLFPTYYFDLYDKVINDEEKDTILVDVINLADKYEAFLKDFYMYYSKLYPMFRVEWLIKTQI